MTGRHLTVRPAPSLGILAYRHARRRRMWGEQTSYISGLLKAAGRVGVPAFAFGPQDVDWRRRRVRAWRRPGSTWQSRWRPLPVLVWDRFFLRREPAAGRYLAAYRRLRSVRRFRWLNPHLPDKWHVHRMLHAWEPLREHLPPSRLYRGPVDVLTCLRTWGALVLKPVRGQKGVGLWFLFRRPGGGVTVRRGSGGSRRLALRAVGPWSARHLRRGAYMVQKYLALRDSRGRPRDVRAIVQRDADGLVVVTGMGVRIGGRGSVIANLHRGGHAAPVERALEQVAEPVGLATAPPPGADGGGGPAPDGVGGPPAGGGVDTRTRRLALVARRVFEVLDAALGPLAELGVDLGVESDGRIWFIEVNSRPGRIIFRKIGDLAARRRAVDNPLLYARRLLSG